MAQWQLAELAIKVGELLGMPLDLAWDGPGVRIGAEGDGVYLAERYGRLGYVHVTGWFPPARGYLPDGAGKGIHVRASRGARVIAAEVDRRLLPSYRAAVARIREQAARDEAEQQARDRLTSFIAGLFPPKATSMPGHLQGSDRSEVLVYLPGHQGGDVKVFAGAHEVIFGRFRVPAAVALRMLETAALMTPFDHSWEDE